MKAKFLIDVNLPYRFSLWNSDAFIHQRELGTTWSDERIWNYATEMDLIIVTKDSDFSDRVLFHTPPSRIIHIRFGNLRMREFFAVLSILWAKLPNSPKKTSS